MKTRIIKTSFWEDPKVSELSVNGRYYYSYLLSSPKINMCGCFELSNKIASMHTGMAVEDVVVAKKELESFGMISTSSSWIYVRKSMLHNAYYRSPKNTQAILSEISYVPENLRSAVYKDFTTLIQTRTPDDYDSTMDTSIHTTLNTKTP